VLRFVIGFERISQVSCVLLFINCHGFESGLCKTNENYIF
jgi:hypothetical protein